MVRPKIEYGCVLYSSAATTNLDILRVVQNRCLKIATGAFKTTNTKILEVESGIYPLDHHFAKVMMVTAASIASVENHPLTPIILQYNRYRDAKFKPFSTRAHIISQRYRIPLAMVQSFPPVDVERWEHCKGRIFLNMHLNRHSCPLQLLYESRIIINGFPGMEHYYTDGSKKDDLAGSGIYSRKLECAHRLPNGYSVFDAELYAIYSTVNFIIRDNISSVIFPDSKSALEAIKSGTSNHPLAMIICQRILNSNIRICLVWIPAHIGIHGNEMADKWAKRSLQYNILTDSPISPKTFKSITIKCINDYWQQRWTEYRCREKYRLTIERYVTENRRVRREEIALCRLRTKLTLINDILPYKNGRHPETCDHCRELLTRKHILIDCLLYTQQRIQLKLHFERLRKAFTVYNILQDDPVIIELLIKYLRETKLLDQI